MNALEELRKTIDEIANDVLTKYQNVTFVDEDGNQVTVDTSKGSLTYIDALVLAAVIWGQNKKAEYLLEQVFPDSASMASLVRHADVKGIYPVSGETREALLDRLREAEQNPTAGGKLTDYERWAETVTGVMRAYCTPLTGGPGSFRIVVQADPALNGGSEIPLQALLDSVEAKVFAEMPADVDQARVSVLAMAIDERDVSITAIGPVDRTKAADDIRAYMNSLGAGETCYRAQLAAITIANGATNAVVNTPAADVVPDGITAVRPGSVDIV